MTVADRAPRADGLTLSGVGFGYGDATVLSGVDLRIPLGELACIVGANGSGKTTLLRLAAGLLAPRAGSVRVTGVDPARAPRGELARRLAYVPQDYRLSFPFTVAEVVLMGRYPHRARGLLGLETADDAAAARRAMERTDVAALANRRFDELSGGERRRALLAQAFCQAAALVLLDEPTSSLDPAHAMAVFAAAKAETRERRASAIIVTHDLNLAARFADRVILVAERGIAHDGPAREVLAGEHAARAFEVGFYVGELPDSGAPFVVPR